MYWTYAMTLMVAVSAVLYWHSPKIPPQHLSHGMYILAFLIWVISLLVLIGMLVMMIVLDVKRMRERKNAAESDRKRFFIDQ